MAEWTAERTVDAELVRALIAGQFPQLAEGPVELFGEGWDNTAFVVDGRWVFRFPRRQIAVPLIEIECSVLPLVAQRVTLAVPVPQFVGTPSERFPWPFAGYAMLAGRTASSARPTDAQRLAGAEPLARFLAALHATPIAEAERAGARPDRFARLDVAARRPKALELLAQVAGIGAPIELGRIRRIIEEAPVNGPGAPTLVHGDLYGRHVIVDDAGLPCGIIDWGDAHLGGAAMDLGIAHSYLPRAGHDAFRRAYGAIAEDQWAVARFRALVTALYLVLSGQDRGDREAVEEGVAVLGRILS